MMGHGCTGSGANRYSGRIYVLDAVDRIFERFLIWLVAQRILQPSDDDKYSVRVIGKCVMHFR